MADRAQRQREASRRYYARQNGRLIESNNVNTISEDIQMLKTENIHLIADIATLKEQIEGLIQRQQANQPAEPVPENRDAIETLNMEQALVYIRNSGLRESNMNSNISQMKTVFKILQDNNLMLYVNDITRLQAKFDASRKANGQEYGANTKKNLINAIINTVKTGVSKEKLDELWDEYKVYKTAGHLNIFNFSPEPVVNFHTYENIALEGGRLSPLYVYLRMFFEVPTRGELENTIFIKDKQRATDITKNYILVPNNGLACLLLNTYKTLLRHGPKELFYSEEVTNLVREYSNGKRANSKLFPPIRHAGVNVLRKSVASTQYSEDPDLRKLYKLSQIMTHNSTVHVESYLFRVKNIGEL